MTAQRRKSTPPPLPSGLDRSAGESGPRKTGTKSRKDPTASGAYPIGDRAGASRKSAPQKVAEEKTRKLPHTISVPLSTMPAASSEQRKPSSEQRKPSSEQRKPSPEQQSASFDHKDGESRNPLGALALGVLLVLAVILILFWPKVSTLFDGDGLPWTDHTERVVSLRAEHYDVSASTDRASARSKAPSPPKKDSPQKLHKTEPTPAEKSGAPRAPAVVEEQKASEGKATTSSRPSSDRTSESPKQTSDSPAPKAASTSARNALSRARKSLQKGRIDEAERLFKRSLTAGRSVAASYYGLGYVELNRGATPKSVEYFKKAAKQGYQNAYLGLGEAYRQSGEPKAALQAYKTYLERNPSGRGTRLAEYQIRKLQSRTP